jgi:hypothetical protein
MKKLVPVLLSLVLAVVMSCATVEGDKKIRDTTEDVRKKEAEARKEREERREQEETQEEEWWLQDPGADDRDYDDADLEFEASGALLSWLFEYAVMVRFSDYPYAPDVPYAFCTSAFDYPQETKFCALQLASSAAYHFDGTFENLNRLTIQLAGFQVSLFHQSLFAATERFDVLSVNAGYSLMFPDVALLSAYAGAYWLDFLDAPLPSFGASLQVFFPGGFYLDLYNLNSVLESLWIGHLTGSLNFAIWRFGLSAGYTYNNFAGNVYQGPSLGISFWL